MTFAHIFNPWETPEQPEGYVTCKTCKGVGCMDCNYTGEVWGKLDGDNDDAGRATFYGDDERPRGKWGRR